MVDRENLYYLREYLTHYKWSVIRNTNIKGDAGEELVERKWGMLQAYLEDIAGLVPDHSNKLSISIKWISQ